MKIAYLTGNRWPGREPGLSFSLHNARGFAEAGLELDLLLPVDVEPARALAELRDQFFGGAQPPPITPLRGPGGMRSRFFHYLAALRHLRRSDHNVLVFRALTFLPWAVLAKRLTGKPVWLEAHDFWTDPTLRDTPVRPSRRRHVRLEQRWTKHVDGILCVSEPQAELYRKSYPQLPVVTAETGCKPAGEPRKLAGGEYTRTLGYVGSLTEGKYPLELVLRAMAGLDGVRFLVVGAKDEGQRAWLAREARAAGVEDRLEVHGWAHGDELHALEARMDLGVACLADTFLNRIASPLKVLEYLAAGLPFVATRLGGIERLVEDGREGRLVGHEPEDWRAAIAEVYADPAGWEAMSARCVATARRLSWAERARKIEAALVERYAAPRPVRESG